MHTGFIALDESIETSINPSCRSHNAFVKCPTMHYFLTEMCTRVHISVTKWCIVGYGACALWDICNWSIEGIVLKRKYRNIDEIIVTDCIISYRNDKFLDGQWLNNISVSVPHLGSWCKMNNSFIFLFSDADSYQRIRKTMMPRQPRVCGPNRPPYECGDGLMGVWLRLMKNPDYAE